MQTHLLQDVGKWALQHFNVLDEQIFSYYLYLKSYNFYPCTADEAEEERETRNEVHSFEIEKTNVEVCEQEVCILKTSA